jgi:osmotically inducible protein OsmC
MPERKASAHWEGAGKSGQGQVSTETGTLKAARYGFTTRFEEDKTGTNPEELLGAAHAGCFAMAFSFACDKAGFQTSTVDTQAAVSIVPKDGGFAITRIALTLDAKVPGLDEAKFQEIAAAAKAGCPLSKALGAVPEISLKATLRK